MRVHSLLALAASAQAFDIPFFGKRLLSTGTCPEVWSNISTELTAQFLTNGQCNDFARSTIRAVFHDCFPGGGCDGSLAFSDELSRPENVPMTAAIQALQEIAQEFGVGMADMIVFAGSHAIATCPSGPIITTYIGRTDATGACEEGQLPAADVAGDAALTMFQAQGFNAKDLAALIGAHTASRQFVTDPNDIGASQDSTPGTWDVNFFVQTIARSAPFTFISDWNLANQNSVGPWMQKFSTDKASWDAAFTDAMGRLELLGATDPSAMVDCTAALPQAQKKSRRDQKSANIFARWR